MDRKEVEELADGFLAEYLQRTPEYIDVAEYVSENAEDDIDDDSLKEVFISVIAKLDALLLTLYPNPED
jgi:hypothetical protein